MSNQSFNTHFADMMSESLDWFNMTDALGAEVCFELKQFLTDALLAISPKSMIVLKLLFTSEY